jgi:tetratricopeptide (TPR) repeat protein
MIAILYFFAGVALDATPIVCNEKLDLKISKPYTEVSISDPGYLVVVETNRELEVFKDERWVPVALPATRFARTSLNVSGYSRVQIRPARNRTANASVSLNCSLQPLDSQWFARAEALAEAVDEKLPNAIDMGNINELIKSAPTENALAFAMHLRSNMLFSYNQPIPAERSFLLTAKLWAKINDQTRQALALLGAAHLADRRDDLINAKLYSMQAERIFIQKGEEYFALRAKEFECRRLLRSANRKIYVECVGSLILRYRKIDEGIEEINLLIDLMSAQRTVGVRPNLEALFVRVQEIGSNPDLNLSRGNFYLLAAQVAVDEGRLADALKFYGYALEFFSTSTEESERWTVNTLTKAAALMLQLGLHDQALLTILKALQMIDARSAPARTASILSVLADVFLAKGEYRAAARWFKNAAELNRKANRQLEASVANLGQIESNTETDNPAYLLRELEDVGLLPETHQHEATLLSTRLSLRAGKLVLAKQKIESIDYRKLSPLDRNRFAIASSELEFAKSEPTKVRIILAKRLAEIAEIADQSPTAALAYLSVRSGEQVRRAWVDAQAVDDDPETMLRSALLGNPARFLTSVQTPIKRVEPAQKQAPGEIGFLAQLSGPEAASPPRFSALAVPELAQMQARVPVGGKLLLLLLGEKQSIALWIARDSVDVRVLAGRLRLQSAVAQVAAVLTKPTSTRAAVDVALAQLSQVVFQGLGADAGKPPGVLWVLADELSGAIPFSALHWPGAPEPLLASTEVSYVTGLRLQSTAEKAPVPIAATTPVFFAPSYASSAAGPPLKLEFAAVERASMEAQLHRTVHDVSGQAANRAALQDLLQTPGTWLHVAAHGRADPGVLGNAGLWLAQSPGLNKSSDGQDDLDFVSWLELGNLRTQAELLVLNACQSGAGAAPSRQANLSFAMALSVGGANHVVAALWPVSDVASKTWIPEFYKALNASARKSAGGLRQAQLALYRSPHYRHPFYWASLVHFERVLF